MRTEYEYSRYENTLISNDTTHDLPRAVILKQEISSDTCLGVSLQAL
jgi:hypothetical protein